ENHAFPPLVPRCGEMQAAKPEENALCFFMCRRKRDVFRSPPGAERRAGAVAARILKNKNFPGWQGREKFSRGVYLSPRPRKFFSDAASPEKAVFDG
ncbi:hypothetical protein, partial [uncultured Desulfovibrio sp.]|uniref:hypothetical protein n=1 Tax=uncultured Desulfovibrio sp. TaxID=167968 RepID=UPI0026321E2E